MCTMTQNFCPGNCSGRGKCMLNGKCWCDPFFSGPNCEIFDGCSKDNNLVCLEILSSNGYLV